MAPVFLKRQPNDDEMLLFPEAAHLEPVPISGEREEEWLAGPVEGELAVDVYETDDEIIVRSAIAGVRPDDLEVFVHNDMLTIRGHRQAECVEEKRHKMLVTECHWGAFSRSLVLPSETDIEGISASIKNGILTVRLPKTERSKRISVREEE